jgi:hypothetical protein
MHDAGAGPGAWQGIFLREEGLERDCGWER